jgi:hypothetical protein
LIDSNHHLSVGATLLKMIRIGDGIIIMALPAGVFGAVRNVTVQGYFIPVIIDQGDCRMRLFFRSPAQTWSKMNYTDGQHNNFFSSPTSIDIPKYFSIKLYLDNLIGLFVAPLAVLQDNRNIHQT